MVGLGLWLGIGLSLYFCTVMLIQDKQNMLMQEHLLLGKITTTVFDHFLRLLSYIAVYM